MSRDNHDRILVTHQLDILPHADRVIVMREGKIVLNGTFEQLIKKEEFQAFIER